jgi:hypothetical protein
MNKKELENLLKEGTADVKLEKLLEVLETSAVRIVEDANKKEITNTDLYSEDSFENKEVKEIVVESFKDLQLKFTNMIMPLLPEVVIDRSLKKAISKAEHEDKEYFNSVLELPKKEKVAILRQLYGKMISDSRGKEVAKKLEKDIEEKAKPILEKNPTALKEEVLHESIFAPVIAAFANAFALAWSALIPFLPGVAIGAALVGIPAVALLVTKEKRRLNKVFKESAEPELLLEAKKLETSKEYWKNRKSTSEGKEKQIQMKIAQETDPLKLAQLNAQLKNQKTLSNEYTNRAIDKAEAEAEVGDDFKDPLAIKKPGNMISANAGVENMESSFKIKIMNKEGKEETLDIKATSEEEARKKVLGMVDIKPEGILAVEKKESLEPVITAPESPQEYNQPKTEGGNVMADKKIETVKESLDSIFSILRSENIVSEEGPHISGEDVSKEDATSVKPVEVLDNQGEIVKVAQEDTTKVVDGVAKIQDHDHASEEGAKIRAELHETHHKDEAEPRTAEEIAKGTHPIHTEVKNGLITVKDHDLADEEGVKERSALHEHILKEALIKGLLKEQIKTEKLSDAGTDTIHSDGEVADPSKEVKEPTKPEVTDVTTAKEDSTAKEKAEPSDVTTSKKAESYSSLKEAFLLESDYFSKESSMVIPAEEKKDKLHKQLTLLVARDSHDPIYDELIKTVSLAKKLHADLLAKYGSVGSEKVSQMLLLKASPAPVAAVVAPTPSPVMEPLKKPEEIQVSSSFSEDSKELLDLLLKLNEDSNLNEGLFDKIKAKFASLAVKFLPEKALDNMILKAHYTAVNKATGKPEEVIQKIKEEFPEVIKGGRNSKVEYLRGIINKAPDQVINSANDRIKKLANTAAEKLNKTKAAGKPVTESYDLIIAESFSELLIESDDDEDGIKSGVKAGLATAALGTSAATGAAAVATGATGATGLTGVLGAIATMTGPQAILAAIITSLVIATVSFLVGKIVQSIVAKINDPYRV